MIEYCRKCGKKLWFPAHLKGTDIDQQKICVHCGEHNSEKQRQRPSFLQNFGNNMKNIGNQAVKVLENMEKAEKDIAKKIKI